MIGGAILIVASFIIIIPSILTIYSAVTSISLDNIVKTAIEGVLGRLGTSTDSAGANSRVPIALSAVGLVVAPILMVDGGIGLAAGGVLLVVDRRKEQKTATVHG